MTWLREVLQEGELTRSAIARELCERDGWKNRQGVPCAASARTALPRLAEALALPLPAPLPQPDNRAGADPGSVHAKPFAGRLEQLGAVRLRLVQERAERGLWRSMLLACHPLGEARAPGKRLTYLLESAHEGVLGGLSFVAAPMRLGPRDKLLGWSPRAREAHLEEVLSNDRFLILDWIKVPHLASHALGIAARQVPADWQRRHGVLPLLLETCVGPDQTGTSYQAAGWDGVGETGGKVPGTEIVLAPKQVWLRALDARWKERLRAEPERQLGVFPSLELDEDAGWGEREFGRSDLSDGRLRERMVAMGTAWERVPGALLPAVFAHKAAQVGAYRFLHNDQVSATDVLQPHREALVERCRQQASVLLVQDTTTLNYSGLAGVADGLGPLGDKSKASAGLYVQAAVAFTEGGRPLGVSGLEVWARAKQGEEKPAEKESGRWLAGFEQGVQLAAACPGTRVTVVGDRESDIYTLFKRQAQCSEQVGLVVRVSAGRQRRVSAEEWIDGSVHGVVAAVAGAHGFLASGGAQPQGSDRLARGQVPAQEAGGADGVTHRLGGIAAAEDTAGGRGAGHAGGAGAGNGRDGRGGAAGVVAAGQRRGEGEQGAGAAHRAAVRGQVADRGVFPRSQVRHARGGSPPAGRGGAGQVPGLRCRGRVAGVRSGPGGAGLPAGPGTPLPEPGGAGLHPGGGAEGAAAAAGRARPAAARGHSLVGAAHGEHGGFSSQQEAAGAGQREDVAGLSADAGHGARD